MTHPQNKIAEVAARFVGLRESSPNQSDDPRLKMLWRYTSYGDAGYRDRQPWCAAFVCAVVAIADAESKWLEFPVPPRDAAVRNLLAWARRKDTGCLLFGFGHPLFAPLAGDLMIFLPHLSHVGIVSGYEHAKTIMRVRTIEGNTSRGKRGSQRDGGGCYERVRTSQAYPKASFVRLPARARKAT